MSDTATFKRLSNLILEKDLQFFCDFVDYVSKNENDGTFAFVVENYEFFADFCESLYYRNKDAINTYNDN